MLQLFSDHRGGSLVQCLSKNFKYDTIVSIDMDKVGVMAAYSILCYTLLYPFHVVLAVNLFLKQTDIILCNYSQNMLP